VSPDDTARRARIDALIAAYDAPPPRPRGVLRRHWKLVLGLVVLTIIALAVWLVVTAPLGRALEPLKNPGLILLDASGRPIARRGDYKEAPVTIAELPKYVPAAFVAIEDRRFYSHWGIDPQGIARAMFRNAEAGGVAQGGSTLTQQLAKTSFLSGDRTLRRKLQEVIIAFYLESRLTKDAILSRYLSSVYFGEGAYGLRAAARTYFDRAPADLTVGQAAMLAGLVQAPSRLAPSRHLAAAQDRERLVLGAMVATKALTASQATHVAPAQVVRGRESLPSGSYFADWVLTQARGVVDPGQYGDVAVATTLDPALQKAAERAVAETLAGLKGANVHQAALVAMRPDGRVVAMVGGLWPALVAAVVASLAVNWFFTEPLYTFTIAEGQNLVLLIDAKSFKVDARIPVKGRNPEHCEFTPDGKHVVTSNEGSDNLDVIDVATRASTGVIATSGHPRGAAFLPGGKQLYVAQESANKVDVIDFTARSKTLSIDTALRTAGLTITKDGKLIYAANGGAGSVSVIDPATNKVIKEIPVGKRPWNMALTPDGRKLYVANGRSNSVSVIDTGSLGVVKEIPVGELPWGVVISP